MREMGKLRGVVWVGEPFFSFWVCSALVWDGVWGDMAFSFWVCGGQGGWGLRRMIMSLMRWWVFWGEGLFCFCLGKREMDRLRVTRFGRLVWAVSFLGYASGVVDRFFFGFLLEGGCWKWPVCLSGMFHSWLGKLLVGRCTCRWSGWDSVWVDTLGGFVLLSTHGQRGDVVQM